MALIARLSSATLMSNTLRLTVRSRGFALDGRFGSTRRALLAVEGKQRRKLPSQGGRARSEAFEKVWGTTGYVAAAPNAAWRKGPIVVAVEDTDRLAGMVRAAERLAAVAGDEVWLMPVGEDDIALDWLESEIRLTLGETPVLKIMPRPEHAGCQQVSLATLTRCTPRMVVARYGGVMLPAKKLALALADAGCPCFLVH